MEKLLILKSIGLVKPTEVVCDDRVLVTQGLSIDTLCELWKWYFHLSPFEEVFLQANTRDFNAIRQRTSESSKPIIELFADNGIIVIEEPRRRN